MGIEVRTGITALMSVPKFFELPLEDPVFRDRYAVVLSERREIMHILYGDKDPFQAIWATDRRNDVDAIISSYERLKKEFSPSRDLASPQEVSQQSGDEDPLPGTVLIFKDPNAAQNPYIRHIDEFIGDDCTRRSFRMLDLNTEYWSYSLKYPANSQNGIIIVEARSRNSHELVRLFQNTAVLKIPIGETAELEDKLDELLEEYPRLLR